MTRGSIRQACAVRENQDSKRVGARKEERVDGGELGVWRPYPLTELPRLLRGTTARWWVAGGWAIDLFLCRQTRRHDDLDIEISRHDQQEVWRALSGWDIQVAADGRLRPLQTGEWLELGDDSLWCRPDATAPWAIQVMLCEVEGSDWVYRRDARIRRPLAEAIRLNSDGLPFVAPEIQLLFKSKGMRAKDESDFSSALPRLNASSRRWLSQALRLVHPNHPWIARFAGD